MIIHQGPGGGGRGGGEGETIKIIIIERGYNLQTNFSPVNTILLLYIPPGPSLIIYSPASSTTDDPILTVANRGTLGII